MGALERSNSKMEGGSRTRPGGRRSSSPDQPLVSVLTVVKNGERYVETAIQSVLGQTYPNIEYVVVDGQSTDSTLDIVRKYDDRISYWISEPDNGLYDAINKGIALSTGEIVGIINSDDWYDNRCVELIVGCFKEDPELGIVHGDLGIWNQDGAMETILKPRRGRVAMLVSLPLNFPTCFIARSIYSKHGVFHTKYRISADYDLILRAYQSKVKFRYLDRILAHRRLGGVSDRPGAFEIARREGYEVKRALGLSSWDSAVGAIWGSVLGRAFQILQNTKLLGVVSFYRRHISRHHGLPAKGREGVRPTG